MKGNVMAVKKRYQILKPAENFYLLCIIFIGLATVIGSSGGGGSDDEIDDTQQLHSEDTATPAITDNGNLEGYTVTVPVTLANGLSGEIDEEKQLYIYLKQTDTGALTSKQYSAGIFPGDFLVPNVFDGEYEVGVVFDINGDTQLDGDDFWGTVSTFLNVDKEDTAVSEVALHEYTLEITFPNEHTTISSSSIHVEGTYTSDLETIWISIPKGPQGSEAIETIAAKSPFMEPEKDGGSFSGTLDISGIIGNGKRFLMVDAEYQAVQELHITDSIPIILDRDEWESGIIIKSPLSRSQVKTDDLLVSGLYEGSPKSISVSMATNDNSDVIMAQVKMKPGRFDASFTGIKDVENGIRVIEAKADYGGGLIETAKSEVFVNREAGSTKTLEYEFYVDVDASQNYPVLLQRWDICPESSIGQPINLISELKISGIVTFPLDEDPLPECVQGISDTYQRTIGLKVGYRNQVPGTYIFTIRIYINGNGTPFHIVTAENKGAELEINASWSGNSEDEVFYYFKQ